MEDETEQSEFQYLEGIVVIRSFGIRTIISPLPLPFYLVEVKSRTW